jgi:hypothetical protein
MLQTQHTGKQHSNQRPYLQEHSPTNHNNYYIWPDAFINSKFLVKSRNFIILNQIRLQILMKFKKRIFIYFI